jgi:hypothetical protein
MNIMLSFVAQLGSATPAKQAMPRASTDFKGDERMDTSRRSSGADFRSVRGGPREAKQCAIRLDKSA